MESITSVNHLFLLVSMATKKSAWPLGVTALPRFLLLAGRTGAFQKRVSGWDHDKQGSFGCHDVIG